MQPLLHIDPSQPAPIWRQIEEQMLRLLAAGALEPGQPVPSVREMARSLMVNPATVARAYGRLTEAGLLEVRRGEGTFVSALTTSARASVRRRLLVDGAGEYAALAIGLGATQAEAQEALATAWIAEEVQDGRS